VLGKLRGLISYIGSGFLTGFDGAVRRAGVAV
jgi:hypothetical protein